MRNAKIIILVMVSLSLGGCLLNPSTGGSVDDSTTVTETTTTTDTTEPTTTTEATETATGCQFDRPKKNAAGFTLTWPEYPATATETEVTTYVTTLERAYTSWNQSKESVHVDVDVEEQTVQRLNENFVVRLNATLTRQPLNTPEGSHQELGVKRYGVSYLVTNETVHRLDHSNTESPSIETLRAAPVVDCGT